MKTKYFNLSVLVIMCLNFSLSRSQNILYDGDFSSTTEIIPFDTPTPPINAWAFWVNYWGNGSEANPTVVDGVCNFQIINPGNDFWNVQLAQWGFPLIQGHSYQLSFDVKADTDRLFGVYLGEDGGNYTNLIGYDRYFYYATTEWQTFFIDFEAFSVFPLHKLSFELGSNNTTTYFDNITLIDIGLQPHSVGIIGTSLNGWWSDDVDMQTTDQINYTLDEYYFTEGQAKFRQDDSWDINWGENTFPTGTGFQEGPNIPVQEGTYNVTFNRFSGAYDFMATSCPIPGIKCPNNIYAGVIPSMIEDFEGTPPTFTVFGNIADTQVVSNPNASGINTSANVAQLIKTAGAEVWAGTFFETAAPIDLVIYNKINVKTWSPKSGAMVKLKLENSDASITHEVDLFTTATNSWENLLYDFSGAPAADYVRIVIFFDFDNAGDDSVYYYDDVELVNNVGNSPGICGAYVTYSEVVAADNCGGDGVSITQTEGLASGSLFPVGTTTNTFLLTNSSGITATCSFDVIVFDTESPVITGVAEYFEPLWPPNHRMIHVPIDYSVWDNCGITTSELFVTSNEPVNGLGDGDQAPDWEILDDHNVLLRAERSGTGTGREYYIIIESHDESWNYSNQQVIITVPHDKGLSAGGSNRNGFGGKEFILYPNSVDDIINIKGLEASPRPSYNIYNMFGMLEGTGTLYKNQIDVRTLRQGIYILKFETEKGSFFKKFIKN